MYLLETENFGILLIVLSFIMMFCMCWFSEWLSIGHLDAQIIPCSQGQEGCKQPNLMQALLTTLPLLQDSLKLFQDPTLISLLS